MWDRSLQPHFSVILSTFNQTNTYIISTTNSPLCLQQRNVNISPLEVWVPPLSATNTAHLDFWSTIPPGKDRWLATPMYWFIMAPYENRHFLGVASHLLSLRGKDPCLRSPDNKCTSGDLATGMWQSSWRGNGVKCCIEKNNRKGRWERWVFASFVFSCFFPFFHFHLSICPKSQGNQKETKKPILWEESGVSLFQIFFVFFLFSSFFSRFFGVPSPNCPKTRGKPKKNKKNNPVRRILGKSIQDCFFCFFLFIWFFSRFFGVPSPNCPKTRGKPKKQKNQSCEKNLG